MTEGNIKPTLNKDCLIWLILQRITEGKWTSLRGAVVVSKKSKNIIKRYIFIYKILSNDKGNI